MDSIITLISLLGLVFKSQFLHWFGLVFCVLFICYRFISMTRKKEQEIGIKAYFSELLNLVLVLIFNIFCLTLLHWWDFLRRRNFFRNKQQSGLDDAIFIRTWQSARFPMCESEKIPILSPGGAQSAYPAFSTSEPRWGALPASSLPVFS